MKSILIMLVFSIEWAMANPMRVPPPQDWSFKGMFATYDRAALQRGFQVYKEVCSVCHSLKRIRFRDLEALGFSKAQVKALAATYNTKTLNASGEEVERPCEPSDAIPSPYPNDLAARAANNGALPVDQSLIIKARPHGEDYLHALLTGYHEKPPAGFVVGEGRYFNPYMAGGQISMPPPLTKDGQVKYSDGTSATVDQMARDVVAFLSWAAEPESEERRELGVSVLLYLALMTALFYFSMRRIWKDVKKR